MANKKTGDDYRAKAINDYILKNLIGRADLGARSRGEILLRNKYAEFKREAEEDPDIDPSNKIRKEWKNKYEGKIKTLGTLIEVLASLKETVSGQRRTNLECSDKLIGYTTSSNKVELDIAELTEEEILHVLQILSQPTGEELQSLGLIETDLNILIKQASLNFARYSSQHSHEQIVNLYKTSLNIIKSQSNERSFNSLTEVENHLSNVLFRNGGVKYKAHLKKSQQKVFDGKNFKEKVIDVLRLMLLQAGTSQFRFINISDDDKYVKTYFTPGFVENITQILIDNYLLNHDFSIYLKTIDITGSSLNSILRKPQDFFHDKLLTLKISTTDCRYSPQAPIDAVFDILNNQSTIETTGEFYIRVWEEGKYKPFSKRVYEKLKIQVDDHLRFYFKCKTTGIGGTQSQFIRVINSALFWGIHCLKHEFFPIAHDVVILKNMVQDNIPSPVLSHSLVKLCRHRTMQETLETSCKKYPGDRKLVNKESSLRSYAEFSTIDPVGYGDYCSFDSLLSTARAALQARLRAIKDAGISAHTYNCDLLYRVEQQTILDEAEALYHSYPFSTLAMESWLQRELFDTLDQKKLDKKDSYITINAYLSITELFLSEGLYRKAYTRLHELKSWLHNASKIWFDWCRSYREGTDPSLEFICDDQKISTSILARYEICLAEYFYILDWEVETDDIYGLDLLPKSLKNIHYRDLNEASWKALDRAQQLLTSRLANYHLINEVSQATSHPHYHLLARIYLLRSKMLLLSPKYAGIYNNVLYQLPTESPSRESRTSASDIYSARLFLSERSRSFSTADGDSELYMICTVYQCWNWLMAAFTVKSFSLRDNKSISVDKATCLSWAKKLRSHALASYAEPGQRYYHAVKEKSGLSQEFFNKYSEYGAYKIDPIPIIQEIDSSVDSQQPGYDCEEYPVILKLDMKYLCLKNLSGLDTEPNNPKIVYLFGPKSCYLFFVRGLFFLCSSENEEFTDGSENLAIDWNSKLVHCYRLFSYSWAIAEDHCRITEDNGTKSSWNIIRFSDSTEEPHIQSVNDLYPHRISEIVDLGKVFSAVCLTLQLYTQRQSSQAKLKKDINLLLDSFHEVNDGQSKVSFYNGQKRFNAHLSSFLKKCKSMIISEVKEAKYTVDPQLISQYRDNLITKIFSLTMEI
ncbi:hypothetical protein S7335_38 [Synechococcus sp. PCC 7335]|uniref:hypothetical protein n=1 Tax=Synechococcus sp. (strain ATCC 29403 / PCC 7335) TaxID=91464 RepID=UPI00017EE832|nr:hypothetical protein [Synechococcus sp. PCC 7335]EDX82860.1 hypothetical protein S7335_38 [Synechococcus sp. PCC 7335]